MRWRFWLPKADPMAGECQHSWSNWSVPQNVAIRQTAFGWVTDGIETEGLSQHRHCLKCNKYERRLA